MIKQRDITSLDNKKRLVLEFYAYLGFFAGEARYVRSFRDRTGIEYREFENTVKALEKKGFVYTEWYQRKIANDVVLLVLGTMAQHYPADAKLLQEVVGDEVCAGFYASVKAAVAGKIAPLPPKVEDSAALPLATASLMEWGRGLLDACSPSLRLRMAFNEMAYYDCTGTTLTPLQIDNIFTTGVDDASLAANLADCKSLYVYLHDGECNLPTADTPSRPYQQVLRGIRSANLGDYAAAVDYFATACKALNREQSVKNVILEPMAAYYMVMSYARLGTPAAIDKLKKYLNKRNTLTQLSQKAALCLAQAFTSASHMPEVLDLKAMAKTCGPGGVPATNVRALAMMAMKYFGVSDEVKSIKALSLDYAIMRHELSDYLDLSDEERGILAEMYGDKPALTSIPKKQKWEWTIDDVINDIAAGAKKEKAQAEKEERLIYMVGAHSRLLVPYTQTWLKAGRWGTPKQVARKRYSECGLACMNDTDKALAATMNEYGYFRQDYPNVFEAAPLLVGCDRVFLDDGSGQPSEQVVFEEVAPYLTVKKNPSRGEIAVSSNVGLDDLHDEDAKIVSRNTPTYFTICSLTPQQRSIYSRLLSLGSFPLSAEEKVKHMLTRLEEISEVRSPLLDSKSIPQLDGSTMLVARVAPASGMAYKVDFMARPTAEGSLTLVPGEGRAVVYDMIDGKNVRVKRDIKGEALALADLLEQIGDLGETSDGSNTMHLPVDTMLQVIDYAQQHPDMLAVEWTEGKKLSLNKPAATGAWNVGLKSKGDWFEVEGQVTLSDNQVLSMASLLELIAGSKGRYVRLNETDYLEISGKLRKQLARLEAVSVKNRNKTVVSAFNAAMLDDKVLDGEIKIAFDAKLSALRKKIAGSMDMQVDVPAQLNAQLRPYQAEGLQWMARLADWGAGACLADDMGLGKTVQTIAFLLLKAADGPALVVAPASVVPNWVSELARFAPSLKAAVLNKAADRSELLSQAGAYDVVVSTYGILNTESEGVAQKDWATVVLDEAHIIKNRETKMSAAAMQLKATNRIILTGTPIQNHLGELWNLFRFINPGLLGSYDSFRQRFVTPIQDGDKDRQHALQRIIKPFMLRRTKADVIDDLPEKTDIVVPVELSEQEMAMYEAMRQHAADAIKADEKVDINTLAEITKLRRAACSMGLVDKDWAGPDSKTQAFVDMAEEFKGTSNRMLVFSQFTSYLAMVRQALDKAGIDYLYLDGSTTIKERERLVKEFRTGTTPIFLISLKAGGLGMNLPEANYVAHLDPWWNPAIEQQATDRAYRIGQKRNVTVYHFLAKNTIEEKMRRLHRTKRDLADSLLEGSDMAAKLTLADIIDLVSTPDSAGG